MPKPTRFFFFSFLFSLLALSLLAWKWDQFRHHLAGNASIADRQSQYGPAARARLAPSFQKAAVAYPPARVALIAIKDSKTLEVWAAPATGPFTHICDYPILAASGRPGPKLKEGDMQVPEGIYPIDSLNPNSAYHLALRVGYPNAFDIARAADDHRSTLGGDIMIHGNSASAGCLAMGDQTAEDLFILTADTGIAQTQLIITPTDFRHSKTPPDLTGLPPWTPTLYAQIQSALNPFRSISKCGT